MNNPLKELAIKSLSNAQQDRPDRVIWMLLATSFVAAFIYAVGVFEDSLKKKEGSDGNKTE